MRIGAVLDCGSVVSKILLSKMAYFTAEDSAMYSASEDDWATQLCFLDFQLIAAPAITNTKPLVDLFILHPFQSESLNPTGFMLEEAEYRMPTFFVPRR